MVLAEPPDTPQGDSDTDAHDHQKLFFLDHGAFAIFAAGFGSRGDNGLVSDLACIEYMLCYF